MVLLTEASGLLEGAHDEGHGCQLCLAIADLVLIQGEGLMGEEDVTTAAGFSGASGSSDMKPFCLVRDLTLVTKEI